MSDDLGNSFAERLFTSPRRHRRPDRERTVLATARRFTIPVLLRSPKWNGVSIDLAAWRWGVGPTVLLVHGWEGRGSQLGALVEPLVAAGLSVVTFDAPAHGDSPGNRLYLTDFADAIGDVVAAIGPVHAIVAHSFGAAGTLLAHARHGVDPARTIFLAPNVIIGDSLDRFGRLLGLDDADRTRFERALVVHSGISLADLQLARLVAGRDGTLLVAHDPDDPEVPFANARELVDCWPGARLRTPAGLGHRRILRDPELTAEIVATIRDGLPLPTSDLVREVDRLVDAIDAKSGMKGS